MFFACLLTCIITTAIGVFIVCLGNKGGNHNPIVIHIPPDDGEPIIIIPRTTLLHTSHPIMTNTTQLTAVATAKVPTTTTSDNSTTSAELITKLNHYHNAYYHSAS